MKPKSLLFFLLSCLFLFPPGLNAQIKIEITNSNSLCRLGNVSQVISNADRKNALTFYNALSSHNLDSVKIAESYFLGMSAKDVTTHKYYSSLYWICKCILADKKVLEEELDDPVSNDLFYFFTENDYERLRAYLVFMYALPDIKSKSVMNTAISRYYNDLLMYNAPNREEWEKTDEIMSWLPLKKGDNVIDLGCGLGFNTFRLAKLVGEEGKVIATDINGNYIDHLNKIIEKSKSKNIFPLKTESTDIGVHDSVDAVFISSFYHDLYADVPDDERIELINSIKQVLKFDGLLIIADNLSANGKELNNRFIDKRLLIAQFAYMGFSYVEYKEFGKQRFVIVFKYANEKVKAQTLNYGGISHDTSFLINVNSEKSLFRYHSSAFNSLKGTEAARLVYDYFKTGNTELAKKAIAIYDSIIPVENFGAEYGALQWLCEVQSSSEEVRNLMLKKDSLSNSFYKTMTANDSSLIKCFLINKYNLLNKDSLSVSDSLIKSGCNISKAFLEEYVIALNPKRDDWEKSSSIIENMKLKKSQTIADIGSGPGYFTYKFSQLTGKEGRVYAVEFKDQYINAINNFVSEQNIKNITAIKGDVNSFSIPQKADVMFMCSFYHRIYGVLSENDRTIFIKCIKENLKTGGKLVIVGSGPVDDNTLPYKGAYISKELIEYQLAFYGFELINDVQIIPQLYMLTFKVKGN